MSSDPTAALARAVAGRLDTDGNTVTPEVEAALHQREASPKPDQYVVDPVSLGSLIVSIATLAWTIYNDLKKHTPAPAPATIARSIRVHLTQEAPALDPAQRDHVIELTVDEITKHDN
jgi:hypothetical protein